MKFRFMVFHGEKVLDALSDAEMQVFSPEALHSGAARTILVRGSKVSVTDGPFAETKEQPGSP